MMQLPYELRSWQRVAAMKFAEVAAARPGCRAIVQAATGAGKSRVAYAIGLALGTRFFIVVHLDTLASQFEEEARRLFPHLRIGVVKAQRAEDDADLVIVSAQTMKNTDRIAALKASETRRGPFVLQVHDECHHATENSTYHKILDAFPHVPALGLSATLARADRKDLAVVWKDGVCSRYPIPAAQADGVLVPVVDGRGGPRNVPHRLLVPGIDVKAAIAADKRGDKEGARKAVGDLAWPVVARETAFMAAQGRKTIVFCPDVDSSRIVADFAVQLGVRAAAVDGRGDKDLPKREVKRRLKAFRDGELQSLVSCQILLEGFDQRDVRSVIWARQTESESVYIQGVGRGLRSDPASGKEDCAISDLVGAHEAHGLVTGESLFLDAASTPEPDEAEVALALGTGEAKPDEVEDRRTILWKSFLSCLAGTRCLASATRGPRVALLQLGKSDRTHVYPAADRSIYFLERLDDGTAYVIKEPPGRDQPAIRVCRPMPVADAQDLLESVARAGEGIDNRESAWREKGASEAQLNTLARLRVKVDGALTAGEASDLATIKIAALKRRDRAERGILDGAAGAFQ